MKKRRVPLPLSKKKMEPCFWAKELTLNQLNAEQPKNLSRPADLKNLPDEMNLMMVRKKIVSCSFTSFLVRFYIMLSNAFFSPQFHEVFFEKQLWRTSQTRGTSCALDVLGGQPIKLAQVASTSELLENQQNDLVFFKIIPSHFCRASEASKIDCFKN